MTINMTTGITYSTPGDIMFNIEKSRKKHPKPDRETLMALFSYHTELGTLHWRVPRGSVGKNKAAGVQTDFYTMIKINGVLYNARDLVWILFKGDIPHGGLKCINGNKLDTRIENIAPRKPVSFL